MAGADGVSFVGGAGIAVLLSWLASTSRAAQVLTITEYASDGTIFPDKGHCKSSDSCSDSSCALGPYYHVLNACEPVYTYNETDASTASNYQLFIDFRNTWQMYAVEGSEVVAKSYSDPDCTAVTGGPFKRYKLNTCESESASTHRKARLEEVEDSKLKNIQIYRDSECKSKFFSETWLYDFCQTDDFKESYKYVCEDGIEKYYAYSDSDCTVGEKELTGVGYTVSTGSCNTVMSETINYFVPNPCGESRPTCIPAPSPETSDVSSTDTVRRHAWIQTFMPVFIWACLS